MMERILVVDDEADIREVFAEILRDEGYTVEEAIDGMVGLELLSKGAFDLILVDKKMPGLDGYDFIREVRNRKLTSKLILITGSVSEPFHPDVDSSLAKPCEVDVLVSTVRKVLAH
jgi:CheY-like chemotaxis protein